MEQISKRIFDLKAHAIEILQEDIESAETQYMRQTRAHLVHMDHFIGFWFKYSFTCGKEIVANIYTLSIIRATKNKIKQIQFLEACKNFED